MSLEVRSLTKKFGGLVAVGGLGFIAEAGRVTALIGPNGAGKTTALNTISGVLRADGGHVLLEGVDVTGSSADVLARHGMARTYQNLQVFGGMTVLDMVMVGAHRAGRSSWLAALFRLPSVRAEEMDLEVRARAALARVGLAPELYQREAATLAYGVQRRVEIARALAGDPRYLLLDEPAAGLNPRETEEMADLIIGLTRSGLSVVLVEHDMAMVMRISDRVVVMNFGQLIACGTPLEMQRHPAVIEAYLGKDFAAAAGEAHAAA